MTGAVSGLDLGRRQALGDILARNARRVPDRTALVHGDRSLTFSELDDRVNRLANALADRGVTRADRVAVLMYNDLEVIETFLACHKIGACPVPVNFRLAADELDHVLSHSQAAAVICDERLLDRATAAAHRSAVRCLVSTGAPSSAALAYEELLASSSPLAPDVDVPEDDLAFLMYTSGTTGRPKGAMLSHRNLVANTVNWIIEMRAQPGDVWLSGLPLFHIGGINGVLPFIYLGGTCVITPSTGFDAAASLSLLEEHCVSMCYFVPTQWQEICTLLKTSTTDLSSLRRALWGGSQAPLETLEAMSETLPHVGIVNAFGQTEMSSNTCFLQPPDAIRKRGSIGRPAINVEARVVDEDMGDVAAGEVGEIVYRGPTVMQGYYRDELATEEAFRGGWFHSGDLVRCDDEGFLHVVGRLKDMIISGGENIYPAEVEEVLARHPGVQDVTVIGMPHPRWVETPVAVVVPTPGEQPPSSSELAAFVKEHLASYKKPSSVIYVHELPRNAAGKVLKRDLRATIHYEAKEGP